MFYWVLAYDDTLALIHYCRLIHKATKIFSSMLLEQWLLTLSAELTKATVDSKCGKAAKVTEVLNDYYKKYQKEHSVRRVSRNPNEAMEECSTLTRGTVGKDYAQALANETDVLRKYLMGDRSFAKFSRAESFLATKS